MTTHEEREFVQTLKDQRAAECEKAGPVLQGQLLRDVTRKLEDNHLQPKQIEAFCNSFNSPDVQPGPWQSTKEFVSEAFDAADVKNKAYRQRVMGEFEKEGLTAQIGKALEVREEKVRAMSGTMSSAKPKSNNTP